MDKSLYNKVMNVIKSYHGLSKDCLTLCKTTFPSISPDALSSIISNEYQKRMKYNYIKTSDTINGYYNLYQDRLNHCDPPGIIVQLSRESGICPCLVAKLILQKFYGEDSSTPDSVGKLSSIVQTYMRDTNLIPDPRLAYETYLCTIYDDLYSPLVEIMKAQVLHKLQFPV
uniref:CDAN1-interacting nuclease 1 n=1 Tax=Photinus pyralis TaxID=7054 RepID=A0A1Y1MUL1_PHOPY